MTTHTCHLNIYIIFDLGFHSVALCLNLFRFLEQFNCDRVAERVVSFFICFGFFFIFYLLFRSFFILTLIAPKNHHNQRTFDVICASPSNKPIKCYKLIESKNKNNNIILFCTFHSQVNSFN